VSTAWCALPSVSSGGPKSNLACIYNDLAWAHAPFAPWTMGDPNQTWLVPIMTWPGAHAPSLCIMLRWVWHVQASLRPSQHTSQVPPSPSLPSVTAPSHQQQ
jgi:hypothetical protein